MIATAISQKVQLANENYTPAEAADVIGTLIKEKINLHRIQSLKMWESSHSSDTSSLDDTIVELIQEKKKLESIIEKARREGYDLSIKGTFEITFTRPKLPSELTLVNSSEN